MKILTVILVASLVSTSSSQNDICRGLPPSIIRGPPRNLIYRNGGNVNLECKGRGVPDVTYEWKKNGFVLNPTLHNVHNDSDGTITIHAATSMDEGFYQCFVMNEYGTALSNTTHVQMAFLESASGTLVVLNKTVSEGMPFTIQCDPRRSFPKPTYIWEIANSTEDENPIPFLPTKMALMAENGDLRFGYALPKDNLDGKLYRCSTYNPYLNITEGGNYTRVTVITPSFRQYPDVGGFATDPIVVLTGANVTVQCLFYMNSEEQPSISWSKYWPSGSTFPIGRCTMNAVNTTLAINDIAASDEGIYRCGDGIGMGIEMRVEAVPMFPTVNDAPYDVNVTEGESFTFSCNPEAKPVAKIIWLQDGKELDPNNPRERFVFSDDNRSLTIRDVRRDCVEPENKTDLMVIQCNASNIHGYAFAQGYLNVLRSCLRKCLGNDGIARWSRPNCMSCVDKEVEDLLDKVNTVSADALQNQTVMAEIARQLSLLTNKSEGLNPGNLNASVMMLTQQTVMAEIARQLSVLTNKSEAMSPGNLNAFVALIKGLAVLRSGSKYSPNEKEIKSIVQATSNVLRPINAKAWKELIHVNKTLASAILFSLDVYGRSLSMLNISERIIKEESLVLEARSLERANLPSQIQFPDRSVWCETGDRISISNQTLNSSISSENQSTLKMWGVYYRTIHKYLPGNRDNVVNSRVLSFSVDGLKTNDILKPPVLITLQHNEEKGNCFQRNCSFWNFDRDEWDSNGCSVNSTNSTHTMCSCDHLTNFAMLMSRNHTKDEWLSIISVIGCSISVSALILTIIVYALTWKQSKSSRATILLNLCVALIVAYIVLLAGADTFHCPLYPEVGCTAIAILLHYFFLAAFFIMLAEGVEMVLYIFFVFHVRRTRETIMLVATAWVLPLIIVGVSLGSTKLEGYGHENACWLAVDNHLIWAFVGPVLCIITVNFVILILVLRLVSKKKDILDKNRKKRDEIRATVWNLSVTCPVLGLGWLFGVFSVAFDFLIFKYLFVIANSLQGLLIFIIYALFYNKKMNEKISSVYSKYFCRCRKTDTQMTSAPEQSTLSRAATRMTSDEEQSTISMAATQMGSAQELSTISVAATQMTSNQELSSISVAATQMTPTQELSTISIAATQMTPTQEQSTSSIAATQITSAPEESTISIAATQMAPTQEQCTISVATQITSTQVQSTSSTAATQMTLAQEQSTISVAATLMATAQELFTILVEATQITSAPEESTISVAAIQMPLAQEQSTNSTPATQMASVQEQSTFAVAATQMTSTEEHSTSSIAAKKKKGFLGVPTAFKFCEVLRNQDNFNSTETQPMSTEDSVTFDSAH